MQPALAVEFRDLIAKGGVHRKQTQRAAFPTTANLGQTSGTLQTRVIDRRCILNGQHQRLLATAVDRCLNMRVKNIRHQDTGA